MDGRVLKDLLASIKRDGPDLDSLLVIRHGNIVSETYYHGYKRGKVHHIFSCTKSFIATLVGIAIDQGIIKDTSLTATDFDPDYAKDYLSADKRQISLEHMLTMKTGLGWNETDSTFDALYRSDDWLTFMYDLPMVAQPGKEFNYCSGCTHLLSAAIRSASGMNTQEFAEQALFTPLGITDYTWETDPAGTSIGGWGLNLTPRDMAKLGYLYLHAGEWDGEQVVSSAWIDRATQKLVEGEGDLGYGYLWWIYPRFGAYAALGRDGQTIFVVPEEDLIVVTTAASQENHDAIFEMIEKFILPAIQEP
jgi:CubicO group peptidase (beta-lactamase class C family)